MTTFLIAFAVMALVVLMMAVGVIFSGREIKGSCGGINAMEGGSCELCGATEPCDSDKPADART
ncbi:MAG: hypothetical protein CMN28_12845 [Salinisphaeraceae bacterium]|jgi:hypothetical protein|nr:hypothetical protein [Salinisphaeraceae bacterium]